ncbi:isoprenylcysteine carboxyl methyltransferase family protein [Virgibacillus halophilus]|uniref:isoprenylcysteine carboxyl methyltransferase family protein n=1 Tax=Tigheibacillus halophilus TaxID=361280 RepID=UPI0036282456
MAAWMWIIIIFIICQRLAELAIAKSNEKWMKERGGIETGSEHYKWFIIMHGLFFCGIILETTLRSQKSLAPSIVILCLFIATQLARVWCIQTLGRFWNTKIIVLPRVALIKKGPYKYVKHPNYFIVAAELFLIPFLFGAFYSAFIFPILHVLLLKIRIPQEEKALAAVAKEQTVKL